MSMTRDFFATVPKGMEDLLAAELRALGADSVEAGRSGAFFRGDLLLAYRVCLWSRIAGRVLLPLARFAAATPEALYAGVRTVAWEEHLAPEGTLAVDFSAARSQITHTHFGALKVKDAVVDHFRDLYGVRPSVARERPDLRINLHLFRDVAQVSIDLAGESLHRRGYREAGAAAPLKENLAAALVQLAGWPQIAAEGGPFVDPLCGSGTLLIEAAMMAGDVAPGLLRDYFGFLAWREHRPEPWERLLAEAHERRQAGVRRLPAIIGYDGEAAAVRAALANIERAGLRGRVHVERRELAGAAPPAGGRPGLVVTNPPYGERLGEEATLGGLYARLGEVLRERFAGWRVAVFSGNPRLDVRLGLVPERTDALYNGPIACRLLHLQLPAAGGEKTRSPGAGALANRLRKNLRHLGRWARREGVDCFRLYDADLPEYALAVDLYQRDANRWLHVQEYEAPATIDPDRAEERLREALAVLPEVLEVPPANLFLKVRRRQRGSAQYERQGTSGSFYEIREGECQFLVNFTDYLDTGIFLDHRPLRQMIHDLAAGRRFLNLFGYTGTATVMAAAGGAVSTVTVDLSKTYLDWARRNLALNGFAGSGHLLVQADCRQWLAREAAVGSGRFDLIFLDPPTFSTSKRMEGTFDVQRDHGPLIRDAVRLLAPGGLLLFSTNRRGFRLDADLQADLRPEEITRATIPPDFARSPRIHQVWKIEAG